jgi:hypothetical protein
LSRNGITSSGARHHQRRPTAGADRGDRRPADLLQRAVDAGDGGNHGGDRAADRVVRRVQPAHHPFDRGNGAEMSVDIVEIALRAVVFGGSRPSLQSRWAAGPIEPPAPLIHIRRRGAGADHGRPVDGGRAARPAQPNPAARPSSRCDCGTSRWPRRTRSPSTSSPRRIPASRCGSTWSPTPPTSTPCTPTWPAGSADDIYRLSNAYFDVPHTLADAQYAANAAAQR